MAELTSAGDDGEPRSKATIMEVLRRNPDLVKALVASGLQRSAVMVATTLGVQNLRVMVWKENTAGYVAMLSMAMSVLSMTTSGQFGRFGDRCGRRVAAIVYSLASFLPAWMLMAFGFTRTGLYASSGLFVLSGVALGSDAVLVLASEATLEADRGMAFGLFQSFTAGFAFILFGIPAMLTTMPFIDGVPKPPISAWLFYQFVLGVLSLIVIATVRVRQPAGLAVGTKEAAACEQGAAEKVSEIHEPEMQMQRSRTERFAMRVVPMYSSICMAWRNRTLRRLYITSFFLFFSGDVVFDLGSLYFRDELGLLDHGTLEEQQTVSVLATLPPQLFVIPATAFTGVLAQHWGSMALLKFLIPISGIMTAGGVLLALIPRIWVVPIVCLMLNVASLASNVPLKHLVADAAPPGRVGEAMGTLGMVCQAISFLANAVVASTTPVMYAYMDKPLWIYYVLCGSLTLLAMVPLHGLLAGHRACAADGIENVKDLPERVQTATEEANDDLEQQMSQEQSVDRRCSHCRTCTTASFLLSPLTDIAADFGDVLDDASPLDVREAQDDGTITPSADVVTV